MSPSLPSTSPRRVASPKCRGGGGGGKRPPFPWCQVGLKGDCQRPPRAQNHPPTYPFPHTDTPTGHLHIPWTHTHTPQHTHAHTDHRQSKAQTHHTPPGLHAPSACAPCADMHHTRRNTGCHAPQTPTLSHAQSTQATHTHTERTDTCTHATHVPSPRPGLCTRTHTHHTQHTQRCPHPPVHAPRPHHTHVPRAPSSRLPTHHTTSHTPHTQAHTRTTDTHTTHAHTHTHTHTHGCTCTHSFSLPRF